MADGSTRVVYAALIGNVLVALSKFAAAVVSGSSAMLTEAIHSLADTTNQVLLLVGTHRSKARADRSHAFGYGMEIYFWTFVVAVVVMLAGGAFSVAQGIAQLRHPEPIAAPWLSLGVLLLAAVFEGASFAVGYREYKKVVGGRRIAGEKVGMWRFIQLSKDPNLYESLLEDSAALAGIGVAALGVIGSAFLGAHWADGAASIAIGLLLVGVSLVIADATRSLIAGESASPGLLADLKKAVAADAHGLAVSQLKTLHLGPRKILVALTIDPDKTKDVGRAGRDLEAFEKRLRAVDSRIACVYFRFE